jgi:hypothetical protein
MRRAAVLASILLVAWMAVAQVGGLKGRCQRLKNSLSSDAQLKLSTAEHRFDARMGSKEPVDDVVEEAKAAVKRGFPNVSEAQMEPLVAIVLVDWTTKQQPEIERLKSERRFAGKGPGQTGVEWDIIALKIEALKQRVDEAKSEAEGLLQPDEEKQKELLKSL